MSHSSPIARHCMPHKQTHQIAMTALRSAAPANGGFGPDRIGRVPSLAIAVSSASTSSTNTSTSPNASHGPGDVLAGRTAVPIVRGLDAVDDDCAMACRPPGHHRQSNSRLQSCQQRPARAHYKQTLKGDNVVAFCDGNCNVIAPFISAPGNYNESPLLRDALPVVTGSPTPSASILDARS